LEKQIKNQKAKIKNQKPRFGRELFDFARVAAMPRLVLIFDF